MLEKWKIDQPEILADQANYCAININILESMNDWVRVIDKEGNILFMNRSMSEDSNVNALEYRCSFDEDIIKDRTVIPRSVSLSTLISNKTFTHDLDFLGRQYSVTSSPVLDDNGNVTAAVEVFRDISEEVVMKKELYSTYEKMVKDINFAKNIQKQLLPKKDSYNNIDIDYYYMPSEELSGDMFGVSRIDDERVSFYICDVVGHGVSASLLTMFINQNISALISEGFGIYPSALLNRLKEKFLELDLTPSTYATIFYGYYSNHDKTITYANAGHNCMPLVKSKDGIRTLNAKGFPICDLFEGKDYNEYVEVLEAGDELYFYTDGITEIKDYNSEEFGLYRLVDIIKEGEGTIDRLLTSLNNFAWGSPEDDIAFLMARVL